MVFLGWAHGPCSFWYPEVCPKSALTCHRESDELLLSQAHHTVVRWRAEENIDRVGVGACVRCSKVFGYFAQTVDSVGGGRRWSSSDNRAGVGGRDRGRVGRPAF